jgi:hypothetical protein
MKLERADETKIVQTKDGWTERQSFHDPNDRWDLTKVREIVAKNDLSAAIGLFSVIYDNFGPEFESFVLDDQARRDRAKPLRSEPAMAEWLRMLAAAAEHYADALLAGKH